MFGNRETPYVVYADTDSGAALIPAAIRKKNKILTFLGEELFDYRDFLSAGASSAAASAWEALLDLRLPLAVKSVLPNSNLHAVPLKKKFFTHAPRLAGIAADDFARSHSRSAARLRRIFRRGVRLKQVAGNVSGLAKWIYQRKAHIDSASLFRDPLRIAFMDAVCRQENCEISLLEAEEHPVAALVTFRERGIRRFYATWFDCSWERYSPGIALLYELSRQTLAEEMASDYLTGDQPYKMRFANSVVPLFRIAASVEELRRITCPYQGRAAA